MAKLPTVHVCPGIALVQKHHERGDETWYLRLKHPELRSGRLHWKRLGPDQDAALRVAKQLKERVEAGAETTGTLRVGPVLWAWLAEYGPQRRQGPRQDATNDIRRHLEPAFGDLSVLRLSSARLWEYAQAKIETEGRSRALVQNTLGTLRAALNRLWQGELERYTAWMPPATAQGRNPSRRITETVSRAKREYEGRERPREPFTAVEAEILLRLAREHLPRFFPVLWLGLGTGMRVGEIIGLRWANVDPERGVLWVRRQVTARGQEGPPKGKPRPVVLPAGLAQHLGALRAVARAGAEYVFEGSPGRPVEYKVIRGWMHKLGELAEPEGVAPGRTFHSTRHTFRSQAAEQGMPETWTDRQAGHSPEMRRTYVHVDPAQRPDLSWAEFGQVGNRVVTLSNPGDVLH